MSSVFRIVALGAMLAVTGCASTNPKDPYERFNRAMFTFNDTVDQAAVKPVAQAYSKLPSFIQTGVYNFFGNLADVPTAINNLLQGKIADGMSDVMRVAFNSTFGLGGLLDIGSEAGLVKHREDFGQTLGAWGVRSGPYVVLPILGPSTVRDVAATPIEWATDPWYYTTPLSARSAGTVMRLVDLRASVLDASDLLEQAALDRYQFVRDAYLQRRESTVNDGELSKAMYEEESAPAAGASGASVAEIAKAPSEPGAAPAVETARNTATTSSSASIENK